MGWHFVRYVVAAAEKIWQKWFHKARVIIKGINMAYVNVSQKNKKQKMYR